MALALALVGGAFCGPLIQASGYGSIATWLVCVVVLSLATTLLADRWHYFISALTALAVVASSEVAALVSYSRHGGDAAAQFRLNLDILVIMLAVSFLAAAVTTLLVLRWRRR